MALRRQVTLFVEAPDNLIIENIRKLYNQIQFELIDCHVTLCREDEIGDIDRIIENLDLIIKSSLTIQFGSIVRFSDGKGVMLEGAGDNFSFHELRNEVLKGVVNNPRKIDPHITLMHPRNSTCNDEIFRDILKFKLPKELSFNSICLIEQMDGGVWTIIKEFNSNIEFQMNKPF